jgi:hypothetical protein
MIELARKIAAEIMKDRRRDVSDGETRRSLQEWEDWLVTELHGVAVSSPTLPIEKVRTEKLNRLFGNQTKSAALKAIAAARAAIDESERL